MIYIYILVYISFALTDPLVQSNSRQPTEQEFGFFLLKFVNDLTVCGKKKDDPKEQVRRRSDGLSRIEPSIPMRNSKTAEISFAFAVTITVRIVQHFTVIQATYSLLVRNGNFSASGSRRLTRNLFFFLFLFFGEYICGLGTFLLFR